MFDREERRGLLWIGVFFAGLVVALAVLLKLTGRLGEGDSPVRAKTPLPLGSIGGRVVDSLGAEPLAARVRVEGSEEHASYWIEDSELEEPGRFSIGGLRAPAEITLLLGAEGHAERRVPVRTQAGSLVECGDLALVPLRRLAGTVVDSAGRGVAALEVAAVERRSGQRNVTSTAARGEFRFESELPSGPYWITVTDPAGRFFACTPRAIDLDVQGSVEDLSLEVELAPRIALAAGEEGAVASSAGDAPAPLCDREGRGRTLVGSVLGAEGRAVEHALVLLSEMQDGVLAPLDTAHTNANGAFRLRAPDDARRCRLRVRAAGFVDAERSFVAPGAESGDSAQELPLDPVELEPGTSLRVDVADESGEPIPAALVRATGETPVVRTTNLLGQVRLPGLKLGVLYTLEVEHPEGRCLPIEAVPTDAGESLRRSVVLIRRAHLSIRPSGPAPGLRLTVTSLEPYGFWPAATVRLEHAEDATFPDLGPAPYRVAWTSADPPGSGEFLLTADRIDGGGVYVLDVSLLRTSSEHQEEDRS